MFFAIGRGQADPAAAEQQVRRPVMLPGRGHAEAGERQHERDHLPPDRVRQERERVHVGAVHRRERRGAPDAGVDARAPERSHERQRAVDAAAPQHPAVEELLRVMRHQPGLAFAVADLLPPVRLHRRAVVMPDERRRREADLPAPRLQPPAHIHIVAGAEVDRVEAADRQQRVAAERHVAAGHVLGDAVVEQHVRRPAGRARDALRDRRIVGRHDVRSARADDVGGQERLDEKRQPVAIDARVGVGVGDDLAGRFGESDVARGAQPGVRRVDDADLRESGGRSRSVRSFEPSLTRMIS